MSEKKKGKQRKLEEEAPTKEEYAVAKYLRFGLPVREGKLHGMEVKCFIGSAAVDKLLEESKWSAKHNKKDPLFTTRASCVTYLVGLLQKGLFHRAEREKRKKDKDKVDKTKRKKKDGEKEEAGKAEEEVRERKGKKDKKSKKEKEAETNGDDAEKKEGEKKTDKKEEKEKKKKEKRLKLVMPEQQFFEDSDEVYVWIYDPVNAKTFFIGLLMVLGAIGLCMFPLWPEEVRVGVYYLSLSAAGFVGFILFLVVVRLILFCCVWVLTLGIHHFWFLPNLTEDVGFFDSFKPLYHHEKVSRGSKSKEETKKKKKKRKGEEDENGEEIKEIEEKKEKSSDKDDSDEFEVIKSEDVGDQNVDDNGEENADDNGLDDEEDDEDLNEDEQGESEEEEEEEDEDGDNLKDENKKTK